MRTQPTKSANAAADYHRNPLSYVLLLLLIALAVNLWRGHTQTIQLGYSDFKAVLRAGQIQEVAVSPNSISGTGMLRNPQLVLPDKVRQSLPPGKNSEPVHFTTLRIDDPDLTQDLDRAAIRYAGASSQSWILTVLSWVTPAFVFVAIWMLMMRSAANRGMGGGGMGGDLLGIGKSKAKVFVQKNIGVKFADVEGINEAKAELMEVVEFLKQPERFTRLGGHIPKGILIVGAPGTGKTLLAKAVAGEANVPFLLISGSEFVEMFVGVGAARVRDLFHQAEQLAPCIIFIDELDALGRARGTGLGSHEEREQTLNQLLVEMDGFDTKKGVIIMAATNRPEILDPALLRAGRFDRHVAIDRPDIEGRERILALHAKRLVLAPNVNLKEIAARTPGCAGADLANIVNEAALHAARNDKTSVDMNDFIAALDRAIAGLEKKGRVMNPTEKRTVAYHEAGHSIIAELRATTDKVVKISIIPRGIGTLGFTQQLPTEDRYLLKRGELLDRLDVLLGGRVTEQIVFGEVSTGAQNDLQRATDLARHMVTQYGMSELLGPAVLDAQSGTPYLGEYGMATRNNYSERTAQQIDAEIRRLLRAAEARVHATLTERREHLESIAQALLERETLERDAFVALLAGKRMIHDPLSADTARPRMQA
jgi:cell division protease FtsH